MKNEPLIMERVYHAPVAIVWQALTDKDQMKDWYFDIQDFKPEPGFEFHFTAGSPDKKFLHRCRITEVIPEQKIAYTWKYDGYEGESLVTFELFAEGEQTRLKLTHAGLETFPPDSPDFAKAGFLEGWTYILGTSLKDFVEKG